MKKFLLIFALLLLPLSVEAKPSEGDETDKVCFCHNINHNPHTICTANEALINAHMDHVNGEVPGVQDSLGECEEETPPEDEGDDDTDDGDDDTDNGDDDTDDGDDDTDNGDDDTDDGDSEDDDDTETPFVSETDQGNQVANGGGNGPGVLFEGGGCTLNSKVTGKQGMNWIWAALLALPLLISRAREKSGIS